MSARVMPCPFCGGSGLRAVPYELNSYDHPPLEVDGALTVSITGDGWYAVRCGDCYAMGPRVKATRAKGVSKAVEAWNKRPHQRGLAPQLVLFEEVSYG